MMSFHVCFARPPPTLILASCFLFRLLIGKKMKLKLKHRIDKFMRSSYSFPILLGASAAIVFSAAPAQAQTTVEQEMDKVKAVSSHLITVTQGMAEASILPVGISSSVKILRHVVLSNV
jgi:hypothetical protein